MKRLLLQCILSILASSSLLAAFKAKPVMVNSPPQRIDRGQARRLFVVGFSGSLIITPNGRNEIAYHAVKGSNGEDPQLTTDFLNQYTVRALNFGDTIEIRAQPQGDNAQWVKWAQYPKRAPEVRLEIQAPPQMNLEVYWTRGLVNVTDWRAPIVLSSLDTHVILNSIFGDITAHTLFGSMKVEKVRGAVTIDNFSNVLTIDDVIGKTKIRTFSGDTHVSQVQGPLVVSAQKASVTAKLKGVVDGRLSSTTGLVSVTIGRESQASVSLVTKGQITAPHFLAKRVEGEIRHVDGKLNGKQGGVLHLRSETGDLRLKVP